MCMSKKSRFRRRVGAVAVAAAVAAGVGLVAAPGWADDYVPTEGAVFTDPNGGTEGQTRLAVELKQLISHADAGSIVQVAVYRFKDATIAQELVAAKERGVKVRVLVPDRSADKINATVRGILESGLGRDYPGSSFITYCAATETVARHPCISGSDVGLMHSKFATFSSVSGKRNIVFQSSGNLNHQTYWNTAITAVNRPAMYTEYNAYFADLAKAKHNNSDYGADRGDVSDGPFRSYFFPRAKRNMLVDVLNNADCSARNLPTPSGRTEVDIAVMIFTDRDVVDKLRKMGKAGCRVRVAYMDNSISDYVDGALNAAASEKSVRSWYVPDTAAANAKTLHAKYMTINGEYYGGNRKLVWTGSLNYSLKAQRSYDENILRVESNAVYGGFRANFDKIVSGPSDQIRPN